MLSDVPISCITDSVYSPTAFTSFNHIWIWSSLLPVFLSNDFCLLQCTPSKTPKTHLYDRHLSSWQLSISQFRDILDLVCVTNSTASY